MRRSQALRANLSLFDRRTIGQICWAVKSLAEPIWTNRKFVLLGRIFEVLKVRLIKLD